MWGMMRRSLTCRRSERWLLLSSRKSPGLCWFPQNYSGPGSSRPPSDLLQTSSRPSDLLQTSHATSEPPAESSGSSGPSVWLTAAQLRVRKAITLTKCPFKDLYLKQHKETEPWRTALLITDGPVFSCIFFSACDIKQMSLFFCHFFSVFHDKCC